MKGGNAYASRVGHLLEMRQEERLTKRLGAPKKKSRRVHRGTETLLTTSELGSITTMVFTRDEAPRRQGWDWLVVVP